jgi:hypothetical protein
MTVEDPSMWKTVLDWLWLGLVGLIGLVWKGQQAALEKKADKATVEAQQKAMFDALENHKNLSAKLFDTLDEHSKDDREFHKAIMEYTHKFQIEILGRVSELQIDTYKELAKKKDRDSNGNNGNRR